MSETLDLSILDSGNSTAGVVVGRTSNDLAVADLPYGNKLADFVAFRSRIERSQLRKERQPTPAEIKAFGRELFDFCIRGGLHSLYARLPNTNVRIQLLTNDSRLKAIPWEFLQEPNQPQGPRRDRSVVRIVPTVGTPPPSLRLRKDSHILFASADPPDQQATGWPELQATIERTFNSRLPEHFRIRAIEATTQTKLEAALAAARVDVFHFSGHGLPGELVLVNPRTDKSRTMSAEKLAAFLRGLNIRIVVLSACYSSGSGSAADFTDTAETLVKSGIPAVVANQLPINRKTVATFTQGLYAEMLRSGDLDLAMNAGRLKVFAAFDDTLDWGLPTLHRHFLAKALDP